MFNEVKKMRIWLFIVIREVLVFIIVNIIRRGKRNFFF